MLRVVGHLPSLVAHPDLVRQVSDKPQGRKLREVYARCFGLYSLWGFEGLAVDLAESASAMTLDLEVSERRERPTGALEPTLIIDWD